MNSITIIPVLADQIGGTAEQWFWLLTGIGLVLGSVVLGIIFVIYMLVKWTFKTNPERKTAPIEYDKAIGYYEKDLAISIKKLGAEHRDVGMSYNNIAFAYYNKGDKEKAMAYLLKAKAIYLKKLGARHPSTKNVQEGIDSLK